MSDSFLETKKTRYTSSQNFITKLLMYNISCPLKVTSSSEQNKEEEDDPLPQPPCHPPKLVDFDH